MLPEMNPSSPSYLNNMETDFNNSSSGFHSSRSESSLLDFEEPYLNSGSGNNNNNCGFQSTDSQSSSLLDFEESSGIADSIWNGERKNEYSLFSGSGISASEIFNNSNKNDGSFLNNNNSNNFNPNFDIFSPTLGAENGQSENDIIFVLIKMLRDQIVSNLFGPNQGNLQIQQQLRQILNQQGLGQPIQSNLLDSIRNLTQYNLPQHAHAHQQMDNNPENSHLYIPDAVDVCNNNEAKYVWEGELPKPNHKSPSFSPKVFLGGIPWEISEKALVQAFKQFGIVTIEWPGKNGIQQPKGYAYAIFESELHVKAMLERCTRINTSKGGCWFYKISPRRSFSKTIQIIPWALCDSNYVFSPTSKLDAKRTIFVGALHGMLNAEGLGRIMDDLFGGVIYAGIDTDKNRYPIGSGRVTFNNSRSYKMAVEAGFIRVESERFRKKFQLDPYLEDSVCSSCCLQQGPYFCRNCFVYFCKTCFDFLHASGNYQGHRPLVRNVNRSSESSSCVISNSIYGHQLGRTGCYNNRSASPKLATTPVKTFSASSISHNIQAIQQLL